MKPPKISLRIIMRVKGVNTFKMLRKGTERKQPINKYYLLFVVIEGTL